MISADALVIGAGPAGLMAAEALSGAGYRVLVAEAKPSAGRKLLMAGKSGLNLTKAEGADRFLAAYTRGGGWLAPCLDRFGPDEARDWARGLGIATFTGSSGRVFPEAMKASPLLRAWLARLAGQGVEVRTRWRWTGWEGRAFRFETPEGGRIVRPSAAILALGGASWPRLGSDGAWTPLLAARGIALAPFRPSNVGFRADWPPRMAPHLGAAIKPVALTAGGETVRGEFVLSRGGVEGGGIYALSHHLRDGAALTLDLAPDLDAETVRARLGRPRGRNSLANHLRKTLRFPPAKIALLRECAPASLGETDALCQAIKALPLRLVGPRPLGEAISTAGGVRREALDDDLMLRAAPGTFCAGEMLDWDAPTGGYLLTACLATGLCAGEGAVRRLRSTGG